MFCFILKRNVFWVQWHFKTNKHFKSNEWRAEWTRAIATGLQWRDHMSSTHTHTNFCFSILVRPSTTLTTTHNITTKCLKARTYFPRSADLYRSWGLIYTTTEGLRLCVFLAEQQEIGKNQLLNRQISSHNLSPFFYLEHLQSARLLSGQTVTNFGLPADGRTEVQGTKSGPLLWTICVICWSLTESVWHFFSLNSILPQHIEKRNSFFGSKLQQHWAWRAFLLASGTALGDDRFSVLFGPLVHYWMDGHEIWLRHSYLPLD